MELGNQAAGDQTDAGNLQDLDRMYAKIKEKKGKLDLLFANARVDEQTPWDTVTEIFNDHFANTDAKGVFFTIQKALPLMSSTGSII